MTCHRICNKDSTTDATSGAGTDNTSDGSTWMKPRFLCCSCCSISSLLCSDLSTIGFWLPLWNLSFSTELGIGLFCCCLFRMKSLKLLHFDDAIFVNILLKCGHESIPTDLQQDDIFIQNVCYIRTSKAQATYEVFHINISHIIKIISNNII